MYLMKIPQNTLCKAVLTFAVSAFCLLPWTLLALETETSTIPYLSHGNLSCDPNETACDQGCCPHADAVCCPDGLHCCQQGLTCVPWLTGCVGLMEAKKDANPVVTFKRTTPVRSLFTPCPAGTTTCAPEKCCRVRRAVCCEDGEHCCPFSYRCDIPNNRCLPSNFLDVHMGELTDVAASTSHPNTLNKFRHKSCPGGGQCPSDTNCCLDDQGAWSCCPDPVVQSLRRGREGQCCQTIFGYICCPDTGCCTNDFPFCGSMYC